MEGQSRGYMSVTPLTCHLRFVPPNKIHCVFLCVLCVFTYFLWFVITLCLFTLKASNSSLVRQRKSRARLREVRGRASSGPGGYPAVRLTRMVSREWENGRMGE